MSYDYLKTAQLYYNYRDDKKKVVINAIVKRVLREWFMRVSKCTSGKCELAVVKRLAKIPVTEKIIQFSKV